MHKKFLLTLMVVLLSFALLPAQELMVKTMGVSPAAIKADTVGNPHYLGIRDRVSTGLTNVGVGTKVYLKAEYADSFLTSVSWSLTAKPGGSAAEITAAEEADSVATFVPDVKGSYTVEVMDGGTSATVDVYAGTFMSYGDNTCGFCHGTVANLWKETGHANHLTDALDGLNRSGTSCLPCHTTGWDALADNGGFDDFEFVYPDTQFIGMSDSMKAKYPDAMKLANIQCESCHGPAEGGHPAAMAVSIEPDACAACHDDDHYHVYPSQWEVSNHAKLNRPYTRTSCGKCHNGKGFIQWVKLGKPDELPEEVDANYNITCATCHDPHDATNEYQLRTVEATLPNGEVITEGGLGKLCMNCHNSRRILPDRIIERNTPGRAPEPHHGPQAEMLTTMNCYTWEMKLPSSPHLQATENACVDCHMYEDGSHGEHDPDGNLNTSGMHSFAMVNQKGVDNVNACKDCHGNVGATFADKKYYLNGNADHDGNGIAEGLQHEVEGLLDTLHAILPQNEDGEPEIQDSTTAFDVAAAMYNWYFVEEDRSLGIHNPAFTVALLQLSIAKVRDVALSINPVDVTVPNEYSLSQNYPNPFNPYTQIDFSIKKAGRVSIKVFDMLGREVATLVDDNMQPGKYKARFDGAQLASGIYMYRIVAEDFTAIKKMVLLK